MYFICFELERVPGLSIELGRGGLAVLHDFCVVYSWPQVSVNFLNFARFWQLTNVKNYDLASKGGFVVHCWHHPLNLLQYFGIKNTMLYKE